MNRWRSTGAVLPAGALALTACGRGSGAADGGDHSGAAKVFGGKATGTVTVWAMGTEGEKLGVPAKDFEKATPRAHVEVTAVPSASSRAFSPSWVTARATGEPGTSPGRVRAVTRCRGPSARRPGPRRARPR
jgi:ABC-type glycerol-3-phosphate transport system substrate-binding protein